MEDKYIIEYDLTSKIVTGMSFKQGNLETYILQVTLLDNGIVKDITGEVIQFRFTKPDGTIVYQDASNGVSILDGAQGKVQCILQSNMLASVGTVKCEIYRSKNGNELTTPIFTFEVEAYMKNYATKDDINSVDFKLSQKIYYFKTVNDMKNANLNIGDMAITLGYYTENDGGSATYNIISSSSMIKSYGNYNNYKIRNSSTKGFGNFLDTEGTFTYIINNGNIAEIVLSCIVNPQQLGAVGYVSMDLNSTNPTQYTDSYNVFDKLMWLDYDEHWTIDLCGKDYYVSKSIRTYRKKTFKNGRIFSTQSVFVNGTEDSNYLFFDNITMFSTEQYAFEVTDKFNGGEFNKIRYTNCHFNGKLGGYYSDGKIGFNQIFSGCGFSSSDGHGITGLKGPGTYCFSCDSEGIPNGALLHNCSDMTWYRSDSNGDMKHAILYDAWCNGGLIVDGGCNFESISDIPIYCTGNYFDSIIIRNSSFTKKNNNSNAIEYKIVLGTPSRVEIDNVTMTSFSPTIADIYIKNSLGYFKYTPITKDQILTLSVSGEITNIKGKFEGKVDSVYTMNKFIQDIRNTSVIITGEKYLGTFNNSAVVLDNTAASRDVVLDLTTLGSNSIYINDNYTVNITDFKDYGVSYQIGVGITGLMGYGTLITITNSTTRSIVIKNGSFVMKLGVDLTLAANNSATFIYTLVNNRRILKEI